MEWNVKDKVEAVKFNHAFLQLTVVQRFLKRRLLGWLRRQQILPEIRKLSFLDFEFRWLGCHFESDLLRSPLLFRMYFLVTNICLMLSSNTELLRLQYDLQTSQTPLYYMSSRHYTVKGRTMGTLFIIWHWYVGKIQIWKFGCNLCKLALTKLSLRISNLNLAWHYANRSR